MASGTLYTYPENFRAYKILIAAQFSNASIKLISEPPEFVHGTTNKTADFLEKFPLGKVPAFETSDGDYIYESNAIAYYVANEQLHGKTKLDAAKILQYVSFADSEILPPGLVWVMPTYGMIQYNKQQTEKAKETIASLLSLLDKDLSTKTFLVGERITLADITMACNLYHLYKQVLDPTFRAPYTNVNRWFSTLVNTPQFKAVIGNFEFCEKMAQFDAKKFAEIQGKDKKESKKEKKSKQQDQPKKGEEKKAKASSHEEEDEADAADDSKKRDPLANLPKSSFVLDAFKRVYSNEDTEKVAIPYLWENFDKEGFSIWRADYKYPEELRMIFMTCNLIGGMFQRLEKMKKHAFASVCIFGEDNSNSISGIWITRGQELIFDLTEDWNIDAPSYDFKKLNIDDTATRKMINEYLLWEGDFDGRKFNQGKIYK